MPVQSNHEYFNAFTFIMQTPVNELSHNLLVLDGFAFNIYELLFYANFHRDNLYLNPHLLGAEFSWGAQQTLLNHPLFASLAREIERTRTVVVTIEDINDESELDSEDEAMAAGEEAYDNYLANRGPDW